MECYNISYRSRPQVPQAPEVRRWPSASPKRWRSIIPVSAAILLHIAAGAALLTIARSAVSPKPAEEQTVGWVFAPSSPAPAERPVPAEPPATQEPPEPASPPTPASDVPPPNETPRPPEPVPPAEGFTRPEAPLPPTNEPRPGRPPMAHTTIRAKPNGPPHTVEPPALIQPQPEAPAPHATAAEAPIAADWQRSLATWLAGHKGYPDEARRRGLEGNVILRFTVDRSGHVRVVALVRSAGSSTLDDAAEAMLQHATLPAFTAGMSQDTVTVIVQIRYSLTN